MGAGTSKGKDDSNNNNNNSSSNSKTEDSDREVQRIITFSFRQMSLGESKETDVQDTKESLRVFGELAEEGGNIEMQYMLGSMYCFGEGVEMDFEEGFKWFEMCALQGDRRGQLALAILYCNGEGVEENQELALEWLIKAAEGGHRTAQINLADSYMSGVGVEKDEHEAAKWYRMAAENGSVTAQYNLARYYHIELGEVGETEALKWYRVAAHNGDTGAQYNLACLLLAGNHKDEEESLKWFKIAARNGEVTAQSVLGRMFVENGDVENGIKWLKIAAMGGSEAAQRRLGLYYSEGKIVAKNDQLAAGYLILSALQEKPGSEHSQFLLAVMYEYGEGVPQDQDEALKWYKLSAENNVVEAQIRLARHYRLEKPNAELEEIWFERAAHNGSPNAQFALGCHKLEKGEDTEGLKWIKLGAQNGYAEGQWFIGNLYFQGVNVQKDPKEAAKWVKMAANNGVVKAQFYISLMYYAGEGVERDEEEAIKWMSLAAENEFEDAAQQLKNMKARGAQERILKEKFKF